MEDQLSPLAIAHLLQHTLRSLCIHETSQWVYAVFWRILPRNYPPPKWDFHVGAYDRARGNRRNWILVWEDGFCNFSASSCGVDHHSGGGAGAATDMPVAAGGLQPELFFKMSHEIFSYGEGLIGKVAADQSHKWVFKEPQENEINSLYAWNNPADSQPRTWEAQFQSGIKTIALIAVREGVVQLGAVNKVMEDLSFVVLLRKKFSYLESIPGVFLPHPPSPAFPIKADDIATADFHWSSSFPGGSGSSFAPPQPPPELHMVDHYFGAGQPPAVMRITPSMSSLEALLSKLPSVGPAAPSSSLSGRYAGEVVIPAVFAPPPPLELCPARMEKMVKEDMEEEEEEYVHGEEMELGGGGGSSISHYYLNVVGKPEESEGAL